MKTQYYTASSLDGFIATEDHSLEWLFALGSVSETSYPAFIAEVGALAMGSSTYEWMHQHADSVAADMGSPWPYTQPAWVFSHRTLPTIRGANTSFVQGDVRPVHTAMRQAAGEKNLWSEFVLPGDRVPGGGDLALPYRHHALGRNDQQWQRTRRVADGTWIGGQARRSLSIHFG